MLELVPDHNGAPANIITEDEYPFAMYGQHFMKRKYQVGTANVVQKLWYNTIQDAANAWNKQEGVGDEH